MNDYVYARALIPTQTTNMGIVSPFLSSATYSTYIVWYTCAHNTYKRDEQRKSCRLRFVECIRISYLKDSCRLRRGLWASTILNHHCIAQWGLHHPLKGSTNVKKWWPVTLGFANYLSKTACGFVCNPATVHVHFPRHVLRDAFPV